jgi:hypothetical protein
MPSLACSAASTMRRETSLYRSQRDTATRGSYRLIGLTVVAWAMFGLLALYFASSAAAESTREGILQREVSDNFARGESTTSYSLEMAESRRSIPILPTRLSSAVPGDKVAISGSMRKGVLVGSVDGQSSGASEAAASDARKVAVLLIKFPGDLVEPWSVEEMRKRVFTASNSVNSFYYEESYEKISLTGSLNADGDVFGWFTLDTPTENCPYLTWRTKAKEAAAAAGVSLSGYDHIMYVSTRQECPWAGIAQAPGSELNLNGNQATSVFAHELGHNLGLNHANSETCSSNGIKVSISDSCTTREYGDIFDVMGNTSTRHNSGRNLAKLGILQPENTKTVTSSGTYTMTGALYPTLEATTLRLPRTKNSNGDVTSWYYFEIRRKGGIFENVDDASMAGVSIRIASGPETSAPTYLLDAAPSTSTFKDAPLPVGGVFDDGTVKVTTLAASEGSATVSIDSETLADGVPPSTPANLSATQDAAGVQLQWTSSTDNVGVTNYAVFRDGSEIGTIPTAEYTDTSAPVGLHAYTVYAEDKAGNRSSASEPLVFTLAADNFRQKASLAKPALRWRRRPNGTFVFEVDARSNSDVVSVGLWVNGRLLRLTKGRILRLAWRPRVIRCDDLYRLTARAYYSTNGKSNSVARVRYIDFRRRSGRCHRLRTLALHFMP